MKAATVRTLAAIKYAGQRSPINSNGANTMQALLDGNKTIIMGVLMIVVGGVGFFVPELLTAMKIPDSPTVLVGAGVTTIFMRLGISKSGPAKK